MRHTLGIGILASVSDAEEPEVPHGPGQEQRSPATLANYVRPEQIHIV